LPPPSRWSATPARRVYRALLRIGWRLKRQRSSHRTLWRPGWPEYVFAFHNDAEIGPVMLSKIARQTGLTPDDL